MLTLTLTITLFLVVMVMKSFCDASVQKRLNLKLSSHLSPFGNSSSILNRKNLLLICLLPFPEKQPYYIKRKMAIHVPANWKYSTLNQYIVSIIYLKTVHSLHKS